MKKYIILFVAISILLTGCAGVGDWSYKLPNDYEVWKINSDEIIVKYVSDEIDNTQIPSFVKEFAYDDRFVCTRNISSIIENDIFNEVYYILDTKEKVLYGPFGNIDEFKKKLDELEIAVVKWYRTSPAPNMYNESNLK